MNNNPLQTLKETHEALKEGCEELKLTLDDLRVGRCTVERKQEVVDRIIALKELYQQQMQELSLTLPDGQTLLRPQYEALERFAGNNNLKVEDLLDGVTINGHAIVECDFFDSELTTLKGLQGVWSIKKLDVRWNKGLTSLKGISTQEIEVIHASACGLTGDLSEIAGATKLRVLYVNGNAGLTSLKGIPRQEIEYIHGSGCGLTGDYTFLSQAPKLRELWLNDNPASLALDLSKFRPGVVRS
jgi:hypothetical protein